MKNRRAIRDKLKISKSYFSNSRKFLGLGVEVTNDSRAKEARRETGERDGNGRRGVERPHPRG